MRQKLGVNGSDAGRGQMSEVGVSPGTKVCKRTYC